MSIKTKTGGRTPIKDVNQIQFSYFETTRGIKDCEPTRVITFDELLAILESDKNKSLQEQINNESDSEKKKEFKLHKPYITINGIVKGWRNDTNIKQLQKIGVVDFDTKDAKEGQRVFDALKNHPSCFLVMRSTRGIGVKAFFILDADYPQEEHYQQMKLHFLPFVEDILADADCDLSCIDTQQFALSQACILSYDANKQVNKNAAPLKLDWGLPKREPVRKAPIVARESSKKNEAYLLKVSANILNEINSASAIHPQMAKIKKLKGWIHYAPQLENEIIDSWISHFEDVYTSESKRREVKKNIEKAWAKGDEYIICDALEDKPKKVIDSKNQFVISRHLSEILSLSHKMINSKKHIYLEAPTGTGKTTQAKNIMNDTDRPVLFIAPTKAIGESVSKDLGVPLLNENVKGEERVEATQSIHLVSTLQSMKHWKYLNSNPIIIIDEIDAFCTWNNTGVQEDLMSLINDIDCKLIMMTGTPVQEIESLIDCEVIQVSLKKERENFTGVDQYLYENSTKEDVISTLLESKKKYLILVQDKATVMAISKEMDITGVTSDNSSTNDEFQELLKTGELTKSMIVTSCAIRGINITNGMSDNIDTVFFHDSLITPEMALQLANRTRIAESKLIYFTKRLEDDYKGFDLPFSDAVESVSRAIKFNKIIEHDENDSNAKHFLNGAVNKFSIYEQWKREYFDKKLPFVKRLEALLKRNGLKSTINECGEFLTVPSEAAAKIKSRKKDIRAKKKELRESILSELEVNTDKLLEITRISFYKSKDIDNLINQVQEIREVPHVDDFARTSYKREFSEFFNSVGRSELKDIIKRFCRLYHYSKDVKGTCASISNKTDKRALKRFADKDNFNLYTSGWLRKSGTRNHQTICKIETYGKFRESIKRTSRKELPYYNLDGRSENGTIKGLMEKSGVLGFKTKAELKRILNLMFTYTESDCGLFIKDISAIDFTDNHSIMELEKCKANEFGLQNSDSKKSDFVGYLNQNDDFQKDKKIAVPL